MRLFIIGLFISFIFSACNLFHLNSNNYDRLTEYEKLFIQKYNYNIKPDTIDYKKFRAKYGSHWDTLKIEEINIDDFRNIIAQNDTTLVYFATPWCSGYDSLTKKVIKYWKGRFAQNNVAIKIINDSYFLGFIQNAMSNENFYEQVYILDKLYGNLIYKNFRLFKQNYLYMKRKDAVKYPVVLFNRKSEVIEYIKVF